MSDFIELAQRIGVYHMHDNNLNRKVTQEINQILNNTKPLPDKPSSTTSSNCPEWLSMTKQLNVKPVCSRYGERILNRVAIGYPVYGDREKWELEIIAFYLTYNTRMHKAVRVWLVSITQVKPRKKSTLSANLIQTVTEHWSNQLQRWVYGG